MEREREKQNNNPDRNGAGEPPASATERGFVAAKAGIKVGSNYARYLSRRAAGESKATAKDELHTRNAESLFSELSKLRGTALKMAQGLSMEPGFLPEQFSDILAQAQYEVPAMGPTLVRRLVKQAFGVAPEEAYQEFSDTAMAAASLGQVHRARLHDGTDVVVKIQYPNVRESVDTDLRLVRGIAKRFITGGAIDPYLEEVRDRMMEETDYILEGQNIEYFAERYENTDVITPRWIPDRTTEKVLTMTYVAGDHLREYLASDPSTEKKNYYGQLLWDTVHAQVASDHLTVHADAHPGNFLFRDDDKLGMLDFGCIKRFPRVFRDDVLALFRSRLSSDRDAQLAYYEELELLTPDMSQEERIYVLEILDTLGGIIDDLYEKDEYDFRSGSLIETFQSVMPKLTGREAIKFRRPIGSPHFVFVNRILAGLIFIMTQLEARIDTRFAKQCLLEDSPFINKP